MTVMKGTSAMISHYHVPDGEDAGEQAHNGVVSDLSCSSLTFRKP